MSLEDKYGMTLKEKQGIIIQEKEIFPLRKTVLPGRWGSFKSEVCPYSDVDTILNTTFEELKKLASAMADLARNPGTGEPVGSYINTTLCQANRIVDKAVSAMNRAIRGTKDLYKTEVAETLRAMEHSDDEKSGACMPSRAWFKVRCMRWQWAFARRRFNDRLKIHDAFDEVVSNARLARLAHQEGYRF